MPGIGSNNPGIRLYKYSRESNHIVDYTQYFLNLTAANIAGRDNWTVEYRATEAYGISVVDSAALNDVVKKFAQAPDLFNRYYLYNSVSRDPTNCSGLCKKQQICAASEVEFDDYSRCLESDNWHRHNTSRCTMSVLCYVLLSGFILAIAACLLWALIKAFDKRKPAYDNISKSHGFLDKA